MNGKIYLYILVCAAVSFLIRELPLTLIRRPIKSRFLRSFLFYVPYVTLAVMTFPSIVNATSSPIAGLAALVLGIAAAWLGANLLQVAVGCCAVVLVLELLLGGGAGVRQLLNSGFLWVMGMLLLFVAAVTLLVFALGGTEELYCVVDIRGFHVRTALPGATRVKLWMHGKSAALMDTADTNGRVIISEKGLAWKDIARVQLWTDKRLMLLYSPRWWMKLSVPILLAKWNDVLTMVDEKLGKKKAVELPEDWAHQLPPQRVQEKKPRKTAIETDVIPPQTTLPEDEEDYRPLDEVLEELRGK